jgi:peptide/nickel transport system substrate-binding protein
MKKFFTVLILMLLVIFTHSVRAQTLTPKNGGRLIFALEADVSTMNPFVRMLSTDELMRSLMYETLFSYDLKEKMVPALGESWTISKDGLEYIITLRRGVKFHNGQELTAEDVKWSVEYAMDPKNGASGFTLLKPVESITVLDKNRVRFKLKEPTAPFLSTLASIRGFVVVPKDSLSQGAKTVPAYPAGTGPFAFKTWETGVQTLLIRNKDYWQKGLPYLDEVVFKPIEDATVRLSSLRAGDVQVIERTPYSFVQKIKTGELASINVVEAKNAGFKRLIFNVLQPPFDNRGLRLAVAYSLDKKQYLQGAFWGFGNPADQRYPAGSTWFVKNPERTRDVPKVKELLKDSGSGKDVEVELLGQQGDEAEQQILQQQLTTAGIKMKVKLMEYGSYVEKQNQRDWQMIIFGGRIQPDPHLIYGVEYTCAEAEQAKAKRSTRNLAGYCNKEVDKVLAEAGRISDQKKRTELYAKAIRQISDDVVEVPLGFYPRFYALSDKVKGFVPDDSGGINATQYGIVKTWLDR